MNWNDDPKNKDGNEVDNDLHTLDFDSFDEVENLEDFFEDEGASGADAFEMSEEDAAMLAAAGLSESKRGHGGKIFLLFVLLFLGVFAYALYVSPTARDMMKTHTGVDVAALGFARPITETSDYDLFYDQMPAENRGSETQAAYSDNDIDFVPNEAGPEPMDLANLRDTVAPGQENGMITEQQTMNIVPSENALPMPEAIETPRAPSDENPSIFSVLSDVPAGDNHSEDASAETENNTAEPLPLPVPQVNENDSAFGGAENDAATESAAIETQDAVNSSMDDAAEQAQLNEEVASEIMPENDSFEQVFAEQDQTPATDIAPEAPQQPQSQARPQPQPQSVSPFASMENDVVAIEPVRATPPQRNVARQDFAPQPVVKPEEIIARSNFSQGYSRGAKTAISPYRSEGASLSEMNLVPARPPLQNQKTTAKNADPIWGSPEDPIIVAAQRAFALGRHEAALRLYDGVLSRDPSNTKAIEGKVEVLNAMGLARSEMDIVPNGTMSMQKNGVNDVAMLDSAPHQGVDFIEARRSSPNSRLGLSQRSGRLSVDPDTIPVQPIHDNVKMLETAPRVDFVPHTQTVYSGGIDFVPNTQTQRTAQNQAQALNQFGDPNMPAVPVNNVQASAIPSQTQNQNALSLGLNSSSLASPERAAALSAQAMQLMQVGQFQAAVPMLEQAFSMDRQNAGLAYNLAIAADQSGMAAKAIQYYEQAIALNRMTGGQAGIDTAAIYARLAALASR